MPGALLKTTKSQPDLDPARAKLVVAAGEVFAELRMNTPEWLQLVADRIADFTLRNLRALARQNHRKEKSL
jgi:hypothetical protein